MCTVSIIIPVYNVEPYIERCIQSVIDQTYTDIECIIVDDCGQDHSMDKCKEIVGRYYGPIHFIIEHHEYNRGLSAARNTGINNATGEWLFFLDSDDAIAIDAIESLVKEAILSPYVELVLGNTLVQPMESSIVSNNEHYPYRIINDNRRIRQEFYSYQSRIPVMAWNKLIRRHFVMSNHLYFREGLIHEDELWIVNVIRRLSSITLIKDYTYLYFKRPYSIMSSTNAQKSASFMAKIIYESLHHISEPCEKLQLLYFIRRYLDSYPYIRQTKENKAISMIVLKKLIAFKFYYITLLFLFKECSNKILFILKYKELPRQSSQVYIEELKISKG